MYDIVREFTPDDPEADTLGHVYRLRGRRMSNQTIQAVIAEMRDRWAAHLAECGSTGQAAEDMLDELDTLAALAGAGEQGNPRCSQCGGPHPFDTTVPSVVWNRVIRANGLPEYLCATCILREFAMRGESFTADLIGGGFHGLPIEIRVGGTVATDAAAISEENTTLRAEVARLTEELDKWKRRTKAFSRGRGDALADHTLSICRDAIEKYRLKVRAEAAEAALARVQALVPVLRGYAGQASSKAAAAAYGECADLLLFAVKGNG